MPVVSISHNGGRKSMHIEVQDLQPIIDELTKEQKGLGKANAVTGSVSATTVTGSGSATTVTGTGSATTVTGTVSETAVTGTVSEDTLARGPGRILTTPSSC